MKYLKLYETKRSDDAISKFKDLARGDFNTEERYYRSVFLNSDLPFDFEDEYKLLFYMYNEFSEQSNIHISDLDKKEKTYMKKEIKKEIQESLISKMIKNNNLIDDLEKNKYIIELQNNEWYMQQNMKFIFLSFVTALKNLPPRIKAEKKFKI